MGDHPSGARAELAGAQKVPGSKLAKPEHEVAYQDICKLVNQHAAQLSALELLAVASNMLGKLLALQDQRSVSKDLAKEVMVRNIELGNQQAVELLTQSHGTA